MAPLRQDAYSRVPLLLTPSKMLEVPTSIEVALTEARPANSVCFRGLCKFFHLEFHLAFPCLLSSKSANLKKPSIFPSNSDRANLFQVEKSAYPWPRPVWQRGYPFCRPTIPLHSRPYWWAPRIMYIAHAPAARQGQGMLFVDPLTRARHPPPETFAARLSGSLQQRMIMSLPASTSLRTSIPRSLHAPWLNLVKLGKTCWNSHTFKVKPQ